MFHYSLDKGYIEFKTDIHAKRDLLYRHMHDNHEIHFIITGRGVFRMNESSYEIHERDLILVPKHNYHCLEIDRNKSYERIIFNFPTTFMEDIHYEEVFSKPLFVNIASHYRIIKIFEDMIYYDSTIKSEEDKRNIILSLTAELLILLKNINFDNTVSKSVNDLTLKIIAYIDEHIYEPLTVDKIAHDLFFSKSHLQNTFLSSMKIGVKSYINMKKMSIAHDLLSQGQRSTVIAKTLGYQTYSCFYKVYMKTFGISPKETK